MYKIFVLLFFFQLLLFLDVNAQETGDVSNEVPKEYEAGFKLDEQRYLSLTNPAAERSGRAYNIMQYVLNGKWKGYNADSVSAIYDSLKRQDFLTKIDFIKKNPDSYASLFYFELRLLNSVKISPDSLFSIYRLLDPNLQSTPLGRSVYASIRRKQQLLLNSEIPVFSFKTYDGELVDLKSFRNQKHVLICFWASWCGPCIKNIPFLKTIDSAYKDKGLQLISVSVDQEYGKWIQAVQKYKMSWYQTCQLPEFINGDSVSLLYEVHFIPQYFLIDKQGKLVYQNVLSKDNDDHDALNAVLHRALN